MCIGVNNFDLLSLHNILVKGLNSHHVMGKNLLISVFKTEYHNILKIHETLYHMIL
jgi:hypothetical protein